MLVNGDADGLEAVDDASEEGSVDSDGDVEETGTVVEVNEEGDEVADQRTGRTRVARSKRHCVPFR